MSINDRFKQIHNEKMLERNAVFIILHCENFDEEYNYKRKVAMSFRWDNKFGFIGGKVDEGETLLEALRREVKEEIGFILPEDPKILCSHDMDGLGIHCYELSISIYDMIHIRNNYIYAKDSLGEMAGLCIVNINDDNNDLLSNNFSATAKVELEEFIRRVI